MLADQGDGGGGEGGNSRVCEEVKIVLNLL
jgi:hypothetical protein